MEIKNQTQHVFFVLMEKGLLLTISDVGYRALLFVTLTRNVTNTIVVYAAPDSAMTRITFRR